MKSTIPAKQTLKDLGIQKPFDDEDADFPPLFPVVCVSDVLHQATVAIDEKGTEASAATAILIARTTSAPVEPPPKW